MTNQRVLLIDDEPDSLNLLHEILMHSGAEVFRAESGDRGLALLDQVQPSLVVVDLAMPHPDGWETLRMIRSRPATSSVPVVAVTAFYSDSVAREAQAAGFDGFVRKPIRSEVLMETLRRVS